MITASQLRQGMVVRHEGQTYRVLVADYHPGQGKMGGATHTRLKNLDTGTTWEHSFRSDLKLEDLPVERQPMEFLYSDADGCCFMHAESYEQFTIPAAAMGEHARFLKEGMELPVEFVDGAPISVLFPDMLEVRIAETTPALPKAASRPPAGVYRAICNAPVWSPDTTTILPSPCSARA